MGELGEVCRQAEAGLAIRPTGKARAYNFPHSVILFRLPASSLRIAVWADPTFATVLRNAALAGDEAMKTEEKVIQCF